MRVLNIKKSEPIDISSTHCFTDDISILIGENGGGKSQLLSNLAKQNSHTTSNVIAISNCISDKFHSIRFKKFKYLGLRNGYGVINKSISDLLSKIAFNERIDDRKVSLISDFFYYIEHDKILLIKFSLDLDYLFFESFKDVFDDNFKNGFNRTKLDNNHLYMGLKSNEDKYSFIKKFSKIRKNYLILKEAGLADKNHLKLNFDSELIYSNNLLLVLETLELLNKIHSIRKTFYLSKNKEYFPLSKASSGQAQLICNMFFMIAHFDLNNKNIILIDEPEGSLHPKWQKEYIGNIFNFFYKYEIQIIAATHSPLIISKLQFSGNREKYFSNINYSIYKVSNFIVSKIEEDQDHSIEAIYWDVFGVITGENSFLSRYIVRLLDELDAKKITIDNFLKTIEDLSSAAETPTQIKILNDVIQIANKIEQKISEQKNV